MDTKITKSFLTLADASAVATRFDFTGAPFLGTDGGRTHRPRVAGGDDTNPMAQPYLDPLTS